MKLLLELLDVQYATPETKAMRPYIDKIAMMLFKVKADWVKDRKRGPEEKYLGVVHSDSTITDEKGRPLTLTFDNSTDSGEFEINSLTPLMIEKGSELDQELSKLFAEHHVNSHKKINYMLRQGKTVLREIHLGKKIDGKTVDFVKHVMTLLKSDKVKTRE